MNSSPGSQTGSIVMLAMTVVITAVGIALVLPLIDGNNRPTRPNSVAASATPAPIAQDYSEFYPRQSGEQTVVASQRVTHRAGQSSFRSHADGQPQPAVLQPQHSAYMSAADRVNRNQFYTGGRNADAPSSQTAWDRQQVTLQPEHNAAHSSKAAISTPVAATTEEPLPFPDTDILYGELAAGPAPAAAAPAVTPPVGTPAPAITAAPPVIQPAIRPQTVAQVPVPAQVQRTAPPVAAQPPVAGVAGVPLYAPAQVPAGSVYAPVTVNFDAAAISDQIRLLEARIDQVADQKSSGGLEQAQTIQLVVPEEILAAGRTKQRERTNNRAQIERRAEELARQKLLEQQLAQQARQQADQRAEEQARVLAAQTARQQEHSQQLARIGQGMDSLTREVHSLQRQTQASIASAAAQKQNAKATADAAAEVIEGYRRELAMERQRADVERELRQQDAIRLAQREAAILKEATRLSPPQSVPAPRSSAGIVKPREMTAIPGDAPAPLKISREVPVNENAKDSSPPPLDVRSSSSSDGMNTRVLPPTAAEPPLPFPPFEPEPASEKPEPLQLPSPDAKPQASTAAPVSFTEQLSDKAQQSVGFSNTYKFSMAVDQDGSRKVVQTASPAAKAGGSQQTASTTRPVGRVCPRCGKIHATNQPHGTSSGQQVVQAGASGGRQNVKQTALQTPASAAHTAHRPPASYQPPASRSAAPRGDSRTDLRRSTKNAGRGMRKMGVSAGNKADTSAEEDPSFLQLRMSTLTEEADEPSILHRMSSTLRQFGRSVR